MSIERHIAELLYTHDCVVVPGLGGFLTQDQPATVNRELQVAFPARKGLAFNAQLIHSDGLLISEWAKRQELPYSEANVQVQQFREQVERDLQSHGHRRLTGLGTLYRTDGRILFIAEQHVNFSRASYGLSALKLKERISAEPTPRTPARVKASPVSKRIERQEDRQHHRPARSVRLQVMNVLGSLFLLMMGIGILNVEMSDYPPTRSEQVANMLGDSGVNDNYGVDARLQSLYNALRTKTHAPIHRILLDGTFPKDEVENIRAEISHSFPGCEIIELENKEYTVCVIAFVNQELAQSYRDLIQKDIQYQLRISAK